jgi:hypothetical protein
VLRWHSCMFSSVSGVEVVNAREGSWRCCFVMCLCLVAKSSDVGVNVDGLAYPLDGPMAVDIR